MGCIVAVILITKPISFFFSLFVKKGGGGINRIKRMVWGGVNFGCIFINQTHFFLFFPLSVKGGGHNFFNGFIFSVAIFFFFYFNFFLMIVLIVQLFVCNFVRFQSKRTSRPDDVTDEHA